MALGWRNVVLQVGSPIEDVTRYLETLQEKVPEPPSLPTLFSIRELRILKENMRGVHKDSLTGLLTRQAFATILKREWEGNEWCEKVLAVSLFDIDHLHAINEAVGLAAGDAILQRVAAIILENVPPGDIVGRWGDDEFIVLTYGLTEAELKRFMEKIREKVAAIRFEDLGGRAVEVSGGGGLKGDEDDWTTLVRKAEDALSQAKVAGGDRVLLRSEVES
jgi:diguanylate cyclase (GGDEF)-like protein